MTQLPILITATTLDEHAYGPVSRLLEQKGFSVIVYKTDRVLSGEDQFMVDLTQDKPLITYNRISITEADVSAAWFRKVASFGLPDADTQLAKQLYMNNEVRALHDTIWPQFYSDDLWLSSPGRIARADRKLGQIILAREIGFDVPDTVVSSAWASIRAALIGQEDSRIIVKMMRGVISEGNQVKALPTTILDSQRVADLEIDTSPFPGLYQPYVEKAREWRVTVVGDRVFPVAIYTEGRAKDDWRQHQNGCAVKFKRAALPDGIADRCIEYLRRFGIGFGAFDFIDCPDGRIFFLECNPNGQYGWLEEILGLPISEAIAAELVRVAMRRSI